jgi:hypothetical protein
MTAPKQNFYVTFGQKYQREAHKVLAPAHPDGWLRVVAKNEIEARMVVMKKIGYQWSFIYGEDEFLKMAEYFPRGELGVIDGG